MGDFDDNDPLEDLLRDASAGSFKSDKKLTLDEAPKFGIGSTANLLEQPKKTRKSALMAELFSTPSDSIFDEITADLDRSPMTGVEAPTTKNSSRGPAAEEYIPSFGSQPPSSSTNSSRFVTFKPEVPLATSSIAVFQSEPEPYIPTVGSRPASTYSSSFSTFKPLPVNSDNAPQERSSASVTSFSAADTNFKEYAPSVGSKPVSLPSTFKPESLGSGNDLPEPSAGPNRSLTRVTEMDTVNVLTHAASPVSTTVKPPVQIREAQQDYTVLHAGKAVETKASTSPLAVLPNLSKVEQILQNFVTEFANRIDLGKSSTEGLSKLSKNLEDISLFLKEIAGKQTASATPQVDSKLEERLEKLEAVLEKTRSENVELKLRLDKCEFVLTQERDYVIQVKKDFEHLLSVRFDAVSTQCRSCQSSTEQKLQALESELSRQRKELESRVEKAEFELRKQTESSGQKAKSAVSHEVSEVLNAELKWLQKWKQKLGHEHAELGKLQKDVQKRISQFDSIFKQIGEMKEALDEDRLLQQKSAQHLSQQWLRLQQKEDNLIQVRKELGRDLTLNKRRSTGVDSTSVFKLLIEEDEKLLKQQEDFILSLKNRVKK